MMQTINRQSLTKISVRFYFSGMTLSLNPEAMRFFILTVFHSAKRSRFCCFIPAQGISDRWELRVKNVLLTRWNHARLS